MKSKLLLVSFLLLSVFSCNSDDDINPENKILGLYEFKLEKVGNNYELDFVNTLKFEQNGKVYGEAITVKSGTNDVLGYRYYFNGTYEIAENKVIISNREIFQNAFMDTFYAPKESLIYLEEDYGNESYLILDGFQMLQNTCPPNANCFIMNFEKIN